MSRGPVHVRHGLFSRMALGNLPPAIMQLPALRMGPGHLVLLFAGTFLVTVPLSVLCKNYADSVSSSAFLQAANTVFISRFGSLWLAAAYWGVLVSTRVLCRYKNLMVNGTAKFCIQILLLLMCNWWFFGLPIFERLNVATGGHCDSPVSVQTVSSCKKALSAWIDGFDLSGHYFFLTTLCILVAHACEIRWKSGHLKSARSTSRIDKLLRSLAVSVIAVWYLEFLVTSLFYHTTLEKLAGLAAMSIVFLCLKLPDKWFAIQKEEVLVNPNV